MTTSDAVNTAKVLAKLQTWLAQALAAKDMAMVSTLRECVAVCKEELGVWG